MYDAIRLYRRALQIEPNIEFQIYQANNIKKDDVDEYKKQITSNSVTSSLKKQDVENLAKDLAIENSGLLCQ